MKNNKITPVGLKGREINERMKELMGIKTINENKSTSAVELTKIGPDGNAYAIIRENREWYIKKADKTTGLVVEDFKYIGGLQNKKMEAYPSYSSALKRLNFKFKSLAEAHNFTGEINIVENDNLLSEAGFAGFSQHSGNGFVDEINMSRYSEPIGESTDQDRYEEVVFMQGEEAEEPLRILDQQGEDAALEYLKQWHDYGNHMGRNEIPVGGADSTYEKDGYIMSWNPYIGYIGLTYDLKHEDDIELSEAEQAIEEMIAREELYGNQHKLDVDGDGEIEASDLAMLRGQKNVTEMQGHAYTDDMENQTSNDDAYERGFDSLSDNNTIMYRGAKIFPEETGWGRKFKSPWQWEHLDYADYAPDTGARGMGYCSSIQNCKEEIDEFLADMEPENSIYENKLKKKV